MATEQLYGKKLLIQKAICQCMTLNHLKHVCCVCIYVAFFLITIETLSLGAKPAAEIKPIEKYGLVATIIVYGLKLIFITPVIFCLFNFFGIVCFNVFPAKQKLQRSPLLGPFVCFRVVTRGLFPQLVKHNLSQNIAVCNSVNLLNFIFEVVSDTDLNLNASFRMREVIVPKEYNTEHNTLFKARALQYSLEPCANFLTDDDWIVHLDEETLLSKEAVFGIINFVCEGSYHFGQGVIIYSRGTVVNWLTTIADCVRVGVDYGSLRFTLKALNQPIFSWKGSFIVANVAAEKSVTFDHGPESSIAEDCFFAVVAIQRGFRFGFVDGEMFEQSAFTLCDYVRQRKRWMCGISLVAKSSKLPLRLRLGPILMTLGAFFIPFSLISIPLSILTPVPMPMILVVPFAFITATFEFLFLLGSIKSFSNRQFGRFGCCVLHLLSLLAPFYVVFLEMAASIQAFWTKSKQQFYIIDKNVNSLSNVLHT